MIKKNMFVKDGLTIKEANKRQAEKLMNYKNFVEKEEAKTKEPILEKLNVKAEQKNKEDINKIENILGYNIQNANKREKVVDKMMSEQ